MADPDRFAARLSLLARNVVDNSRGGLRRIVKAIHLELVVSTPVGGPPTSPNDPHPGLARSNWQVLPGTGTAKTVLPEVGEGQALAEGQTRADVLDVDGVATISNPVEYINLLNDGSSTQAPAGFAQKAINRGIRVARSVQLLRRGR